MRHTVKLQNVIIGWSDLEQRDPVLHRAWGRFRPGVGYELVEPVFRLFTEAVPLPASAGRLLAVGSVLDSNVQSAIVSAEAEGAARRIAMRAATAVRLWNVMGVRLVCGCSRRRESTGVGR